MFDRRFSAAMLPAAAAWLLLTGCNHAAETEAAPAKEFVVSCASGAGYDPSGCHPVANQRCKGEAEFLGVLSSTAIPANKIHTITARYRCPAVCNENGGQEDGGAHAGEKCKDRLSLMSVTSIFSGIM